MRQSLENKDIEKKKTNSINLLNKKVSLTQEDVQNAGGLIKFVVGTKTDLAKLDPQICDVAYISDAPGFAIFNGQVWVALAHYNVSNIGDYNEIVLLGNCAELIVVTHVNQLPDIANGSLGYVTDTEAYYIKHDSDWVPLTPVKVTNYTDLPSSEKNGSIYFVEDNDCFYIKRESNWKALGPIKITDEADLIPLVGVTGDIAYVTSSDKYYIFRESLWKDWDNNITVVDVFPEIPDEPTLVWHTGDNQVWTACTPNTNWIPLMKYTDLTGEVGT